MATSKRKHLPALNPARLLVTLQQIAALNIPVEAQRAVAESLKAAANPQSESPEVVIRTLPRTERDRIQTARKDYARTLKAPINRGKAALMAMGDAEWDALLKDGDA